MTASFELTQEALEQIDALRRNATPGPYARLVHTPRYLAPDFQRTDGLQRLHDPVTIRSAAHTEEVCTFWNYLLNPVANADYVISLLNYGPALIEAARAYLASTQDQSG